MPPPLPGTRLSLTNATPTRLSKRLSRASSIRSIQFNSEPGSRVTSPNPKARLKLFNSAPVEKAEEPTQPASDSSITFFEQGAESTEFGFSLPVQSGTVKHTVGAGDRNSVGTEDSFAFQIEDDSNLMQNHSIPGRRDGRSASVAESGGGDLGDNESISFMVDNDTDDEDQQEQGTLSRPAKRDIGKPNASPLQRSHLVRSCPSPRLSNAGIRADTENTRNESIVDRTDALPCDGGNQAPVAHKRSASRSLTPTSSLIPDGLPRSPNAALEKTVGIDGLDTAGEAGMAAVPSSASSRLTKKAIVMKRLQQQEKHHSRLPQPRKGAATHALGDAERLPLRRATHPPLYQPAAVSTPLDAQAVETPSVSLAGGSKKDRSNSLSSRSSSRGKGAQALLLLHPPHPERQHHQICRSKESVTSQATGESPNQQLVTEKGSTGSTDPPPTPLFTGLRSPTSREAASAAASGLQSSKMAFPPPPGQGPPKNILQGYLANQEVENQYYRHYQHLNSNAHPLLAGDRANPAMYNEHSVHQQMYALEEWGEPVAGTFGEAEQWRQFNERQRAELFELRKRIAIARRQDCTLLESSPSWETEALMPTPNSRCLAPQQTPMRGRYSSMGPRSQVAHRQPAVHGKEVKSGGEQSGPSIGAYGTPLYTGRPGRGQTSVKVAYAPTTLAKPSPCLPRWPGPTMSPPSPDPCATSATYKASPDRIVQSAAAASVADLLGILWPPRTSATKPPRHPSQVIDAFLCENDIPAMNLYFSNGSRLTPEQVVRFLDLVRVQLSMEFRTTTASQSRMSLVGTAGTPFPARIRQQAAPSCFAAFAKSADHIAYVDPAEHYAFRRLIPHSSSLTRNGRAAPLSAKLAALLPKKAVRRSRVLREVFDAMDLKRQGNILLDLLPSLARLFEVELTTIEHARESLLRGNAVPLQSLLESAVESRHQCAVSWNGARGSVAAGAQRDLDAVAGGPLDYAGLPRDMRVNIKYLTHRLLLLSFALNVVIPIVSASRIPLLDFSAFCMIVYAAVDNVDHPTGSPQEEWRQVVQQYFIALAA
ncbi:hypothetical protein, conserved [Leishmania lindenbergi]|uniref:EF-hand domain-containing protein n=1 Tax=Leishmania lindenbergi TaxID=651832 RepID=A0AAW3A3E5_9TRYP